MLIQIDYNIRLRDYLKNCVKTTFYIKPFTKKWVSYALVCACSSKMACDNLYAPLQIISEYFPACGRPLRVRFFKKIQDWILKSERIWKWILRFFTKQINPRYLGSWCIKGTEESTLEVDSLVPLMHMIWKILDWSV